MRMSPFLEHPSVAVISALLVSLVLLAGCASKNPLIDEPATSVASADSGNRFLGILTPYRVDVQQGNFVSREMLEQLQEAMRRKEGVTPEQVRFVLGTPLLTDVFHADRWDYVFRLQKGNGEVLSSRVTVFFADGRVARVEGGDLPTEAEYLNLIAAPGKRAATATRTTK